MEISLGDDLLNGTIAYLSRVNTDVFKNISTKSSTNSQTSICVLKPENCPNSFTTEVGFPQWLQIEFKKSLIYIKSYSLLSSLTSSNSMYHIKGWKLRASIDGKKWDDIHEESNFTGLNGNLASSNFEVAKKGVYRFFRLLQTQKGFTDVYGFSVRKIDFFGTLYETDYVPKYMRCTAKIIRQNRVCSSILLFVLLAIT